MGTLYIVATPIGNLEDVSLRAIKTLFSVDYIACEDTRRTGMLIKNLKIKKPKLISFYDEVEEIKTPAIIDLIQQNKSVALVSDAGTPLISDPGFKLVRECLKRKIKITAIPGPSSVITALTLSGLPTNQFLFLGYLPAKSGKRKKLLQELHQLLNNSIEIKPTAIFFETPHRLAKCLDDIKQTFGDIEIVIARELTKIHEEVIRGRISDLEKMINRFKGELVILF